MDRKRALDTWQRPKMKPKSFVRELTSWMRRPPKLITYSGGSLS